MAVFDRDRPSWERDGRDWPNRDLSRFVAAGGLTWHVQEAGAGPVLLLVHGTGAATHSWRGLLPRLAERFRVVALDLPGHGFTDPLPATSLPGMAAALRALVETLGLAPAVVVGHSAGAAILVRLCLDGGLSPRLLVGLNAALKPFPGMAGLIFPSMARMLFLNPVTPRVFAWSADRAAVERLITGTGSTLDRRGLDLYRRLFQRASHVAGALAMMANWNLDALDRDLPRLAVPALLIVGEADRAIAPETARDVARRLPRARVERVGALGHLAHEERPDLVAGLIEREAQGLGVLAPAHLAGEAGP
ncbi:4,5:9,10-diseco-3-hydroxy-5,9, 17-trioxoandrosta-1(10),2-diene-4-oate hydrolase [Methylobacterium crusticola]|uniref:4,5:9,10-diseco-3-hydroxy-5,9, 17-trioxoandrosta-1(10),2-diene-4-oate hydrolase n=1 Tax=Methylobacterium crusticola TaxID=1697972 RepID=A0ABQ4QRY0_9HYPH|nr:alpha/beta fold hydrolase BchO [Methylobacterium crusticola]GJD48072.1 4,5:9,10-diseco-3-hydroxy-5,9, 17-trioxoandrosta-1(10),2-diene-4-oate hydrolase [Methylobacterium crusticola]